MMDIKDFTESAMGCFDTGKLLAGSEEYGLTEYYSGGIDIIAAATNLTEETVLAAAGQGIHCLVTHHDAWSFLYGVKERCHVLLEKYKITHLWAHLLLDDAKFGTGATLLKELGLNAAGHCCRYDGKYDCGHIGIPGNGISLEQLAKKVKNVTGEPARFWKNRDTGIEKVAIVTGGGSSTADLKGAFEAGCDTYITGEKLMYTLQYAAFIGMNLIVGTHTGTERPGVCRWVREALKGNRDIGIFVINETIGE